MNGEHVAFVTGGSRGIGAAICRRLGRDGVTVLVAARSQDECKAVAEEIRERGGQAWPIALDVADPDSVRAALDEARLISSAIGPVDWLVNDAGIAESASLSASDEELYRRHMDVNFHGARRLIEGFLSDMRERSYGRIVNIASSAGLRGYAYASAYCASKFALVGYTLAAAPELKDSGVTMNVVCPHYVQSPMLEASVPLVMEKTGMSEEQAREFFRSENPGGRLVTMEEVAEAAWDALVEDYNGAILELDGSGALRRRA
ncbi:MAG: SDR family NAD(P)-dependent oxidoreductase [Planctomycetota bacterium]|nr:SDR family NAD(P)-dependent oxidoreductase [Planctomycetota bacterium]